MKIDICLSELCGSYHDLRENMERALANAYIDADVEDYMACYDDAVSRDIKGSHSIWINGKMHLRATGPGHHLTVIS